MGFGDEFGFLGGGRMVLGVLGRRKGVLGWGFGMGFGDEVWG